MDVVLSECPDKSYNFTKEVRLILQSGIYTIFRKARPSFFRVLRIYRTLTKEGRAFRNICKKDIYIPDCKISLASFVLYFHFLLIRSFISIRSVFFVSWSFLQKLNYMLIASLAFAFTRAFAATYHAC